MKRIVILIVILAAAAAGYMALRPVGPVEEPTVVRTPVSFGAVTEIVKARGALEPLRRVNVGSQVSGTVKALYADYNSVVKAGQLLAEIDPSLLQVQVDMQQAGVDRQATEIAQQETVLANQRQQFDRQRQLFDRGLQTVQQLEAAALAIKVREAQIFAARKQMVQAEAGLAAARLNVGYTKIHSPIDGVVILRRVDIGQAVQASVNTPSFFVIATALQTLKLTAWVVEADIGRVRPGQEVRIRVGTYGDDEFPGVVEAVRLQAYVNSSVVAYPVWIDVPNDDLRLRPGMTTEVSIHVSQTAADVPTVPNSALRFRPTRAVYQALGAEIPTAEPERAIDQAGDRVVDPNALRPPAVNDDDATTIDELFSPMPKADARGTVWTWDAATKRFTPIVVRVGVSDGSVSELLSGELQVGDELVTNVVIPVSPTATPVGNPLMGNRRGR